MPINVLMPALSPTMEKGNLAKWHKKEGDEVVSGDVIAEIETDKATMEVEAVDEGKLGKILIEEGAQDISVNTPIAIILEDGEDEATLENASAPAQQPAKNGNATDKQEPQPQQTSAPVKETTAEQHVNNDGDRVFASPLARRIAKDKGLDLSKITGSGPRGRIVKADVENAKPDQKTAAQSTQQAQKPVPQAQSDDKVKALFKEGTYEEVPHDSMRRVIAERLTIAKSTIPHFYLSADFNLDKLLKLRAEINAAAPKLEDEKPAYKISVNDFVIRALALALRDIPDANVTWTEGAMLKHQKADVGVAVSIPGGLITPVVREACCKSLSTISNEMKDYAKRARAKKLMPHEYQGGTTAVSNLGMFNIKNFSAVINPPHATILAVGAGEKRPIVNGDEIAISTIMSATLSTDHRAVDGALGAVLMGAFRTYIENPMSMLV